MRQVLAIICGVLVLAIGMAIVPEVAESRNDKKKDSEEPLPTMSENQPLEVEIWGGIRDLYKIAVPKPLGSSAKALEIQSVQ